ncbi:MAG: glycosyltransferase family 2 protein [Actinomycetota bacterium]|nr:MAG: glycosyltransferase family 2 protein [Actinomycetota bacterium]
MSTIAEIFKGLNWVGLSYFLALNTIYLILITVAAINLGEYFRRKPFSGFEDALKSPVTLPVSVLIPAHNEEAGIVESARAVLSLEYPQLELIIVDDGSTDLTFEKLRDAFDLVEIPMLVPELVPTIGLVDSVHIARGLDDVTVIRKQSIGQKTDALNVAINVAKYPLLCIVDADAVLDADALIKVTMPFVDDPHRVVATGGAIRPSNGCTAYRGRITEVGMPKHWLARIQVVEYLRAFLLGRTGWSKLGALLIISGAFGVFRKDVVIDVGGYNQLSIGEDADLVARIHKYMRKHGTPYRIVFVSEPVCWTEVPEDIPTLRRQRRRWSRGLLETIWSNPSLLLNPRYGTLGLLAVPYFLLFEVLGPVVELTGFITLIVALVFHFINFYFAGLFFAVAIFYGILLSILSLLIEEVSYHRYDKWRFLYQAIISTLIENFGYRQMHAYWRLEGVMQALRKADRSWGPMPRKGFIPTETSGA